MTRKYYNDYEDLAKFILAIIVIFVLYLVWLWKTNRISFWLWVLYGIVFISIVGIIYIAWSEFQSRRKKKKLSDLLSSVRQTGAEENIINFINSFGYQKKTEKNVWRHGDYSFTWEQLKILRKTLYDKGVQLSLENHKDLNLLLNHFIYHKNEQFIQDSITHQPKLFSALTGTEFENLLSRLYEAMGYSVMKTGKTGDQGCDLVVNMGEQRSVVQAKCYNSSVPNAAIQQAVGALKLYNCTKAFVVTNSYFTPEAIQLAKVNNVGLVSGERLREMLLQYLKENWS